MSPPLAIARQYQDITEVFRARRIELGLSYAFLDAKCGFSEGHAEAMLGPSAKKGWGQATFFMLCEVLTVEFHAHVNMDAVKRMEGDWEKRCANYVRERVTVSKKLLKLAKPLVLRDAGRLGGLKSASKPSARLRNKKGGKSRMRKVTKAQRCAMNRKGWITRRKRLIVEACALADPAAAGSLSVQPLALLSDQSQHSGTIPARAAARPAQSSQPR